MILVIKFVLRRKFEQLPFVQIEIERELLLLFISYLELELYLEQNLPLYNNKSDWL